MKKRILARFFVGGGNLGLFIGFSVILIIENWHAIWHHLTRVTTS
jgi:hypothetical protein